MISEKRIGTFVKTADRQLYSIVIPVTYYDVLDRFLVSIGMVHKENIMLPGHMVTL